MGLSKAFEFVPSTLLIQKLFNTNLNTHTMNWLTNYLTGRHAYTVNNEKSSTTKGCTNGVPQGTVLPHPVFKNYLHDIPLPTHPDTHILSYADDITVFSRYPYPENAATHLQE